MIQEQPTINYDQFSLLPPEERRKIFNDISADNRALLMKTHVDSWLAANQSRLTQEQLTVVEEMIRFITPEKYQEDRPYEKIIQELEKLLKKAEAVFPREDIIQMTFLSGGQCASRRTERE